MHRPNIDEVVAILVNFASRRFGDIVSAAEAKEFVEGLLFGPRALWSACDRQLVTINEVAAAIADRFEVWMMNRSGRAWSDRPRETEETLVSELETTLLHSQRNV